MGRLQQKAVDRDLERHYPVSQFLVYAGMALGAVLLAVQLLVLL